MFVTKKKYNDLIARIDSVDTKIDNVVNISNIASELNARIDLIDLKIDSVENSANFTTELITKIDVIDNKIDNAGYTTTPVVYENHNIDDIPDPDYKKKVAYALNLCTVSVSQIIDYNDLYILEQEYDAILNNLNLQNFIKDEPLLKVLKQILDTITFFKIQEGDKKFLEKEYQHKMKNAIWSAVPNPCLILAGGNPVNMAIAAATQIGIGYMNYRKSKSQATLEKEKQQWELQRSAMEQFNGLRRELFETAWLLSDAHDFDDVFRLTEKQITHYNNILIDSDPLRRFEKLDSVSDTFEAFPPFWYYKGNAAREIFCDEQYGEGRGIYKEKALDAFRSFQNIYVNFMREDILAASCALEHISLLDPITDRNEIERLLGIADVLAGDNFDVLQMCVLIHLALNQLSEAKDILRRLVNEEYNLGLNGLLLSRIYCKYEKNKAEYDILTKRIGESNMLPWCDDDDEADGMYIELRKKDVLWRFDLFAGELSLKYFNKLKNEYGYHRISDLYERIEHFSSTALGEMVIESLNELYKETSQMPLFNNNENTELCWESFSERITPDIDRLLEVLFKQENKVRSIVDSEIDSGNVPEILSTAKKMYNAHFNKGKNNQMKLMIDALFKNNVEDIYKSFTGGLKKSFREMFTVKTGTVVDAIINDIDNWYVKNSLKVPNKDNNTSLIISGASDTFEFNAEKYIVE